MNKRMTRYQRLRNDHAELANLAVSARAADPRLADAHDRIREAERRLVTVDDELAGLERDLVNEGEVATALAGFDAVWDCLSSPEQAGVLGLLVERVTYDGDAGSVSITVRPTGIKTLPGELAQTTLQAA